MSGTRREVQRNGKNQFGGTRFAPVRIGETDGRPERVLVVDKALPEILRLASDRGSSLEPTSEAPFRISSRPRILGGLRSARPEAIRRFHAQRSEKHTS